MAPRVRVDGGRLHSGHETVLPGTIRDTTVVPFQDFVEATGYETDAERHATELADSTTPRSQTSDPMR